MYQAAVNQDAIRMLKTVAADLNAINEQLAQETKKLSDTYENKEKGLGAHTKAIADLLLQIQQLEQIGTSSINRLCLKLEKAAAIRQSHMDKNRYGSVKKSIKQQREKAVSDAWTREKKLVLQGKGTRDWTVAQQAELLEKGKISGYEGQHMKDVKHYPEYAGDPDNIQFLPEGSVHMKGAHGGAYRNGSNGWYDEKSGKVIPFEEDELRPTPIIELTSPFAPESKAFTEQLPPEFGYGGSRRENYINSKQKHRKNGS